MLKRVYRVLEDMTAGEQLPFCFTDDKIGMLLDNAAVVGSEAILALYPILIKTVPTTLTTQLLSRFATFAALGFALASPASVRSTWGSTAGLVRSLAFGAVTLVHVAVSYYAFEKLPAGIAMSLFYTYPVMNVVAGALFFGESVGLKHVALIALALVGTVLVSLNSGEPATHGSGEASAESPAQETSWKGIAAALAAAATETIMYFAVRTRSGGDAFKSVLEMYPGALLGLVAATGLRGVDWKASVWTPMTLFNIVVGFLGYALRFYVIPNVETAVFSILSFVGVAAAFGWGWLFVKEVPRVGAVLGALMISAAAAGAS
jgi:drug/metabolite transporter (DMT)-like permease